MAIPKLNEKHFALTVGSFAAVLKAIWAALIGIGYGEKVLALKQTMHFVRTEVSLASFDITTAISSIIVAFIICSILGWIFAVIWNYLATQKWAR
ncbi:MAG: hypothetical protein ACP5KK_02225 [Candidatus Nanoarchaeia archaeon]